jgi:DNA-directed RNA polymerase subunit omega
MARITIEDALKKVESRYELMHLVTKRVLQLKNGSKPLLVCENKEVVTALREIAAGLITHEIKNDYHSDEF